MNSKGAQAEGSQCQKPGPPVPTDAHSAGDLGPTNQQTLGYLGRKYSPLSGRGRKAPVRMGAWVPHCLTDLGKLFNLPGLSVLGPESWRVV